MFVNFEIKFYLRGEGTVSDRARGYPCINWKTIRPSVGRTLTVRLSLRYVTKASVPLWP